jgi:hypothetical protein
MATQGINDFKAKLVGGGARANLFRVLCNFPTFAGGSTELASFMIKGASLPSSVITAIEVPFRGGRKLKIAGDKTFEPWNITVINDTGMEIRNALERWSNAIENNVINTGLETGYMVDMVVEQLNRKGDVVKTYNLRGAWPSNVGAIELSYDTGDAIEEFTCELTYQYWDSPESVASA